MATASELREKLAAKQDELGKVFAEARTDDGKLDYNKVKCLGDEVKGSVAVAEKVGQMDAELIEIAKEAETIEAADQAAEAHKQREKAMKRPTHAAPGSAKDGGPNIVKSLSQQIAENMDFKAWTERGMIDGGTLKFPDMLPSDMMSIGTGPVTLRSKTLMQASAGWDPESIRLPGFVEDATRPITLLDIIPLAQTDSDTIKYMEETTRTHAAAEKSEGSTFAESTFAFTERTSPVQKITDSLPVTDEQLEDVAFLNSYIVNRITFGLRQRLDLQVLVGNGTPPNLDGIKNVSNILTTAKGGDPIPDAFFKAMVAIRVTGRAQPTHHIIHPTNWQTVRLLRTADGVYIWGNPSESGVDRMWGLPVIQSDNDSAGTGYVGSFLPAWISLFERRGVDIQVGYTGSQFVEGKRTIRGDLRAAFVLFRPEAFSTVTGL